jgi:DNA-binding response OmpR family regulator
MEKKIKILLVEDEESLAAALEYNLEEEGYMVEWAKDGREAIDYFDNNQFDLIVLDIMLPYLNGFEVAEHVRSKDAQIPILILTARGEDGDRIKGLEAGADDYLTKPFHLQELILRIKGMLKRKSWYKKSADLQPIVRFGDNEVNFENLSCKNSSSEFTLTVHEAMLLKYLIENRDKVISRGELLKEVWNLNSDMETSTVDIFISRLRKYFEPNPVKPQYIKSVRGAGYMFSEK